MGISCIKPIFLLLTIFYVECIKPSTTVSRRTAVVSVISSAIASAQPCKPAWSEDGTETKVTESPYFFNYESRDRKGNKDAIIREDYWYLLGKTPPRRLESELKGEDPQWNAFGSCTSSGGGSNSCTYVSLSQRIPAYSKYGFAIADGASDFQKLGSVLERCSKQPSSLTNWQEAGSFVVTDDKTIPPAIVDAELKMILFATAMLTSPNFPGPGKQLLVARFYANEAHFAAKEIVSAIQARDATRALQAWYFGKDSWNSYFQVVNGSISPKVGEKFKPIL